MIPIGMCQCGCGRPTSISNFTNPKQQSIKGRPQRYLQGHCPRYPHRWERIVSLVEGTPCGIVPLTRGLRAIVDVGDYERIMEFPWQAKQDTHTIYAYRRARINEGGQGKEKRIWMHRFVLNAAEGEFVDHINHNGLDNRRCNLRTCTATQNMANTRAKKHSASGFKNVSQRDNGKWRARGKDATGKRIHLGDFETAEDASKVADDWAMSQHGDFAFVNSPH